MCVCGGVFFYNFSILARCTKENQSRTSREYQSPDVVRWTLVRCTRDRSGFYIFICVKMYIRFLFVIVESNPIDIFSLEIQDLYSSCILTESLRFPLPFIAIVDLQDRR